MGEIIGHASNLLNRISLYACGFFLIVLVSTVTLQVVARYVFVYPPYWTEELARYCMIWAGMLGATLSFKYRFDPALRILNTKNRPGLARVFSLVRTGAVLVFILPILFYCFVGAHFQINHSFILRQTRSTADALSISMVWVAIAVPITLVVILIHLAARWVETEPGNDTGSVVNDGN